MMGKLLICIIAITGIKFCLVLLIQLLEFGTLEQENAQECSRVIGGK